MLSRLARGLTDWATDQVKASSKNIFNEETTKQVGERIGQTLAKHLEDNNMTGEGAVKDFKDYTEKVIDYNIGTSVSNRTLLETDDAFDKKLEPFMEGEARQLSDLNQLSLLDPDSEFRSKLGESIEPLRRTLEDFDTPDIEMEDELDENLQKFLAYQFSKLDTSKNLSEEGLTYQLKMMQKYVKENPLSNKFNKTYPDQDNLLSELNDSLSTRITPDYSGDVMVDPAYTTVKASFKTRNQMVNELEKAGIGGEFGTSLYEITETDLNKMSSEGKRLMKALKKEDWFGYEDADELMVTLFDEGLEALTSEPSAGLKNSLGRYVNKYFGGIEKENISRQQKIKNFIKPSAVKVLLYRAYKVGTNLASDLRFFNPSEVGVHLGTSGQADAIIRKKTLVDKGDYSREDLAKYIIQNNGSENTVIDPIDTTSHLNFKKAEYYVSLENPLVFPYQEPGEWSADMILTDGYSLENFDKALKMNLKSEAPYSPEQMKKLKELVQQANEINYYRARFIRNEVSNPLLDPDKPKRGMAKYKMVDMVARWNLNLEFQEWIRSFGFDSIKYVNDIEPSYATDVDHLVDIAQVEKEFKPDALQRKRNLVDFDEPRHWSYIAFKPEQLKTTDAVAFDPKDPRHRYAGGGVESDMRRVDGTIKDEHGFLGPIKNNVTGKIMTEMSITVQIGGKEVAIPSLVPTLTPKQREVMVNNDFEGRGKDVPLDIQKTAKAHAVPRIEAGLSPFYKHGEENRKQNAKGGKLTARGIKQYA